MHTKNPRAGSTGASPSTGTDARSLTKNGSIIQPQDDLARLRALHLIARLNLTPEIAVALAVLACGGAA